MDTNIVLSSVPLSELLNEIRGIIRAEIKAEQQQHINEKLYSPQEACKMFNPKISKITLAKWTNDQLIPMQKIGGRCWYRYTDLVEAGTKLKKYERH